MRSAALVALVVGLVVLTGLASPAVATGLEALGWHFRFTRVFNRVFEILLVAAIVLGWRRLDLGGPQAWGFRRAGAVRALLLGLAVGAAGIALGLGLAWLGGGLAPALRFAPLKTVRKGLLCMAAAILIGVGEEALFRGLLLRRLSLDAGSRTGLLATTAIYAVVHGLRGGNTRLEGPWSGLARAAALAAPLGDPSVLPGIGGLFGLGIVLGRVRQRTGSLWASVGIHAAWVAVFRVGRLFFDIRHRPEWLVGPGWPPLVGGAAGLAALVLTATLAALFLRPKDAASIPS